jgi:hypothetical protein
MHTVPSAIAVGQFGPGEQTADIGWKTHAPFVQVATASQPGTLLSPYSQMIPDCAAEQELLAMGSLRGHREDVPPSPEPAS